MAYLLDVAAKTHFPLAPHHTFGRLANSVETHIDKPYVSKLHAAIEWNGRQWRIKNLGLNGTWINGISLSQGDSRDLNIHDEIHFAEQTDPGFIVADLSPPTDMLWPLDQPVDQLRPITLSRYHLLPDANEPELAVFYNEQTQQWHCEALHQQNEHEQPELNDGDLVQFGHSHWQFVRAQIYGPTEAKASRHLNDYEFIFNMSMDEETTQLELHHQQTLDLAVRTHHYLLLQLARHRAEDAERGLDSKSQGWIYADQLAAELGVDGTHLNIQIFRARKQLADSLPDTAGQQCLLERRGGKIRFGCEKFKIYKGDQLTLASPYKHC
ncbi:FHA domain-containing protein [Cellvibrio sp. pealriver]|uniref:FHA domain-containing protein n=1 Tax=Cellvibrio sp. pealriver TaxID=1622269 RepID=UPI00066FED98|nr:FHA domain-containing protein [Cellvibrio sp. pealriver]